MYREGKYQMLITHGGTFRHLFFFFRKLQGTKREYGKTLGLPFIENINEKILQSWDTIYYFNEKSLRAINADKQVAKN